MKGISGIVAAVRLGVVRRRLRRMGRPHHIVVVCYANICRSPYLAGLLRAALPDIDVSSAGFAAMGHRVPQHSLTIAERRGIDLSKHQSRVINAEILASADLAVVMDERQAGALTARFGVPTGRIIVAGDLDARPGETRSIHDPWNQPLAIFESSFGRLERCADRLVGLLNGDE